MNVLTTKDAVENKTVSQKINISRYFMIFHIKIMLKALF